MTFATAYVQTAQDKKTFNVVYGKGLADERLVKQHLAQNGRVVVESTKEENIFQDIDCYVDGIPTSIKAMHKGAAYGTIGMELYNLLTERQACATSKSILANKDLNFNDVARLAATGNWETGWWHHGKAEQYAILIGEVLRVYSKKALQHYMDTKGFVRIRPLKVETQKSQGGSYRYSNSISVYLPIKDVPTVSKELIEYYN